MNIWKKIHREFLDRPFETQVIMLISALASVRVSAALVSDFLRPEKNTPEILVDFCFLLLFVGLLFMAIRNTIRRVHPLFGFFFVMLLAMTFVQFGGIYGTSKLHIFSGVFITILLYGGKNLVAILVFQLSLLGLLIFLMLFDPSQLEVLALPYQLVPSDFLSTLIALGALAFYLKWITIMEIERHGNLNDQLRQKVSEAMGVNAELVKQADQLKDVQRRLEVEVSKRAKSVEVQNDAIETYIHINTKVLYEPIKQLHELISELPGGETELQGLLFKSAEELNEIFSTIKNTLDKEEELNRSKLRT